MSKVAFVDENCIKCETLQISRVGLGRIDTPINKINMSCLRYTYFNNIVSMYALQKQLNAFEIA